jgi:hypothetical protein
MSAFGFPLKLHRIGLVAVLVGLSILGGALAKLYFDLSAVVAECARNGNRLVSGPCSGLELLGTAGDDQVRMLFGLLGLAPFVVGSVLGAPIVAREIETGTTALMWSLSASRARWLGATVIPVAIVAALGLVVVGLIADRVEGVHVPSVAPDASMADYGTRGLIVALRFGPAFVLAVLVGLVLKQTLPALVVALALNALVFLALNWTTDRWVAPVAIPPPASPKEILGQLVVEPVFIKPDGSRLSLEVARAIDPSLSDPKLGHLTDFAIEGRAYPEVQQHELVAVTIFSAALSAAVIWGLRKQRPD